MAPNPKRKDASAVNKFHGFLKAGTEYCIINNGKKSEYLLATTTTATTTASTLQLRYPRD
jgi:hypothetical protein